MTVVDALNLLAVYSSQDFLADRGQTLGEDDRRSLVGLFVGHRQTKCTGW